MAIRISTIEIPIFRDALVVGSGWTTLPARLTDAERACLVTHVGKLIRIHPDDVSELVQLGLALEHDHLVAVEPIVGLATPDAPTAVEPTPSTTSKKKTKE